jgi:1-acyl-sn-glycerol-3-phosphate acyltransferase
LPVAVRGGIKVWNRAMWLPRPAKVRVEYLKPILPAEFPQTETELTERIRHAIAASL